MKFWRVRVAGLLLALLWGSVVNAAPMGLYQFKVAEMTCLPSSPPNSAWCQYERMVFTSRLETITFLAPLVDGPTSFGLHLETQTYADSPDAVFPIIAEVRGITAMNLSSWDVDLDLERGLCLPWSRCFVEADFASDGGPLTGMFRLGTIFDDVYMNSDASLLWSGYIFSDGPVMTGQNDFPTFSGHWRLVPEPGTLALLLVPLLYLAAIRVRTWPARG